MSNAVPRTAGLPSNSIVAAMKSTQRSSPFLVRSFTSYWAGTCSPRWRATPRFLTSVRKSGWTTSQKSIFSSSSREYPDTSGDRGSGRLHLPGHPHVLRELRRRGPDRVLARGAAEDGLLGGGPPRLPDAGQEARGSSPARRAGAGPLRSEAPDQERRGAPGRFHGG